MFLQLSVSKSRIVRDMKLTPALIARVLAIAVTLGLASCSLPPEAAWRVIKSDGLIPLIAMELGARPYPASLASYNKRPTPSSAYMGSVYDRPAPSPAPVVVVHTNDYMPKPLPTRPDATVGTTSTASRDQSMQRPPRPNLITKGRDDARPRVVVTEPEPEHAPPVVATAKPSPEAALEPEPEPASKPEPKKEVANVPAPAKPLNPASQPPVRSNEESLPYGTAIPGRPGLVNSPYAAKNQFVDVAGLKPGQEVKCPYSGKLFRVPVGAQASGPKAVEDEKKQ